MFVRVAFYDHSADEGDTVDLAIPFDLTGTDLEVFVVREFVERMPEFEYLDFEVIDERSLL